MPSSEHTPYTGISSACAIAAAVASPTRSPVNGPGPSPATIAARSAARRPAWPRIRSTRGASTSACARGSTCRCWASTWCGRSGANETSATAVAAVAVSMASTRTSGTIPGVQPGQPLRPVPTVAGQLHGPGVVVVPVDAHQQVGVGEPLDQPLPPLDDRHRVGQVGVQVEVVDLGAGVGDEPEAV